MLELYSSQRLKSEKASIVNGDSNFQNALDNALNYQNIETLPERISNTKPCISKYNWEGIQLSVGSKYLKKIIR